MTTRRGSSRSLLSTRAVRADAALGTGGRSALGRLSPAGLASRAGSRRFPLAAPSWPEGCRGRPPRPTSGSSTTPPGHGGTRCAWPGPWCSTTSPGRWPRAIASPLLRGTEYLETIESPVIFAANHASHVDTPLLLSCLPLAFRHRTVVAAAADYFFDRRWKADFFAFSLNAIPIERNKVNRRSAQLAAELIEDGWSLIIFPEGGRSPDGWAQEFRGGAAYLSARTGRPVVPVHLDGTRHILPKGGQGIKRTRTTVTFGTPLWPEEGENARALGDRIETAVATLADETSTDWWTARKRAVRGATPPLQGPDLPAWRRSWALPTTTADTVDDDAPTWPRTAR